MLKGYVHPNFSTVAGVLAKQLPKDQDGGAAVCIYHRGECVVDIWGGTRNEGGDEWEEDTLSLSFSTTKGIASTLLHICADRGLIRYDDPVAKYWPEFGQSGKGAITIRQVMCHEAGLYDIRGMVPHANEMTDWEGMIRRIETTAPAHHPGRHNGYHGLTYGWLVGEIVQRVTGKSFAVALEEMITGPLNLDGLYVGIPENVFNRRAYLIKPGGKHLSSQSKGEKPLAIQLRNRLIRQFIDNMIRISGTNPNNIRAGLLPRGISSFDFNGNDVVKSCIPSANGMFTARSLARVYAALANGGSLDGARIVSPDRVEQMSEVQNHRRDKVVPIPMKWRLGYHRVFTTGPRTPHAFGHFGFGGSGAWCDPSRELSVALTLNSGVGTPFGDSRIAYLNSAAIQAADKLALQKPSVIPVW